MFSNSEANASYVHSAPETTGESAPETTGDSSSSDEELPVIFTSPTSALASTDFVTKGALVWVKYLRYPYWPSVINHVYYRKKLKISRVSVIFLQFGQMLGTKGTTILYKPDKILPFGLGGDNDLYNKFKVEGLRQDCFGNFKSAFQRAESFVMQKANGGTSDVFEYFKEEFGYALSMLSEDESDSDDEKAEQGSINTGKRGNGEDGYPSPSDDDDSDDIDDEDDDEKDEVNDSNNDDTADSAQMSPKLKEHSQKIVQKRINQNKKFVEFIARPKAKSYLFKIFNMEIKSDLHNLFYKTNKTREEKARCKTANFGPIAEDEHQEEIVDTLLSYSKETTLADDFQRTSYVFSVWLPEAITYSLQKIGKISRENALKRFNRGPKWSKVEINTFTSDLMKCKHTIDPEDRQRYQLSRERRTTQLITNI